MKIETTGLDDLQRMVRNLERLEGHHSVPFDDLFHPAFMAAQTDFRTIDEMFAQSGYSVETSDDFEEIPDAEWDAFVARRTRFANWHEMQEAATQEWATRQLSI